MKMKRFDNWIGVIVLGLLLAVLTWQISEAIEIVRQKGVATNIAFPLVDADGDPVTDQGTNGGGDGSADCFIEQFTDGAAPSSLAVTCSTESPAEIEATGVYTIPLDSTEMDADYIYIMIDDSDSSFKTQHILIRTIVGDPLNLAVTNDGGAIDSDIDTEVSAILLDTSSAGGLATEVTAILNDTTDLDAAIVEISAILADTTDLAAAIIEISAILADTTTLAAMDTKLDAILTDTTDLDSAIIEISAILADTTSLDAANLNTKVTAILADTTDLDAAIIEISAILADTSSSGGLATEVTAILADTTALTGSLSQAGAGALSATPTLLTAVMDLHTMLRNKAIIVDNGDGTATLTVYADDGTTPLYTITLTDDGTNFTAGETAAP